MDFPSEPAEGTNPADTLILDFWSPELWRIYFYCFKPVSLWQFVMTTVRNSVGTSSHCNSMSFNAMLMSF